MSDLGIAVIYFIISGEKMAIYVPILFQALQFSTLINSIQKQEYELKAK